MTANTHADVLPRLLAGLPRSGWLSHDEHLALHGPLTVFGRHREPSARSGLIEDVEASGLRGRGGAGFPTAIKMRTVADRRGRPIVVANGMEGEPTSLKDRLLLERVPHLVLDGAIAAANAVGAREIIVCIEAGAEAALTSVDAAIDERRDTVPKRQTVRVVALPDGYVAGQESAIVNVLNGGPSKPTVTPVFERGVTGRPTLVDNVETLAHVGLIARYGPEWFRSLGTDEHPGSTLVTVGGGVKHAGVFEIEPGLTLGGLIGAAGGVTRPIAAVLVGGYAGSWLTPEQARGLEISHDGLARQGAALGAGLVHILADDACGVAEVASVARWMSDQSAGQCGPCVHGLAAIADTLDAIVTGRPERDAIARLTRWCSLVTRRGACAHPDGAVRFIASGLQTFEREFEEHVRLGPCEACHAPRMLAVPERHGARAAA